MKNKRDPWLLGLLCLAAFALHLVHIGQESFWIDEVFSLEAIRDGIWRALWHTESTPPLFFMLLKGWSLIFGQSHVVLRAFSALLGALAVPAIFYCAWRWRMGRAACWVAAVALAIHPMAYWHSQQNRYYMAMMLFGIFWLAGVPALLDPQPRRRLHWPFIVAGALTFFTHYYFLFYAAGVFVGLGVWWFLHGRSRRVFRSILFNFAGLAVACVPVFPLFLHQRHNTPGSYLAPPTWEGLRDVYTRHYTCGLWVCEGQWAWPFAGWRIRVIFALTAVTLCGYVFYFLRRRAREKAMKTLLPNPVLLAACTLPVLFSFFYSRHFTPVFIPERYPILFLPAFILWMVAGWEAWPGRWRCVAFALGLAASAALSSASLQNYWNNYQEFDWVGAAKTIERRWQPGDAMVFCPGWNQKSFTDNGGVPRNVIGEHDMALIQQSERVWLFMWEQAPAESGRPALTALGTDVQAERVIVLPQMSLSLLSLDPAFSSSQRH